MICRTSINSLLYCCCAHRTLSHSHHSFYFLHDSRLVALLTILTLESGFNKKTEGSFTVTLLFMAPQEGCQFAKYWRQLRCVFGDNLRIMYCLLADEAKAARATGVITCIYVWRKNEEIILYILFYSYTIYNLLQFSNSARAILEGIKRSFLLFSRPLIWALATRARAKATTYV